MLRRQNTSAECTARAAGGEVALAVIINGQKSFDTNNDTTDLPGPPKRFVPSVSKVGRVYAIKTEDETTIMGRLLGRLFVAFTTGLICFISYTPQIFIIWPWYGRELSIELLTLLVPFKYDLSNPTCTVLRYSLNLKSVLVGILLYNYYLCVTTDPGGVPDGWVCHGPSSMMISTYVCAFRGQNLMTQKVTKSKS